MTVQAVWTGAEPNFAYTAFSEVHYYSPALFGCMDRG
jgi:hypothetical protein